MSYTVTSSLSGPTNVKYLFVPTALKASVKADSNIELTFKNDWHASQFKVSAESVLDPNDFTLERQSDLVTVSLTEQAIQDGKTDQDLERLLKPYCTDDTEWLYNF